ncbi:MAG: hypothetical protein JKY15_01005 [Deltaproteobacteria bacterium]|nr:hypothetical protein [Deltaproteobacteria bacterium]
MFKAYVLLLLSLSALAATVPPDIKGGWAGPCSGWWSDYSQYGFIIKTFGDNAVWKEHLKLYEFGANNGCTGQSSVQPYNDGTYSVNANADGTFSISITASHFTQRNKAMLLNAGETLRIYNGNGPGYADYHRIN